MGDKALIQYSAKLAMDNNETLKCAVCHERLSKPIKFCKVGHLYCDECKKKLNDCAICHLDFSDDCHVVLEQILEKSTFPCKNEIYGCKVVAKFAEINKHEDLNCDFKMVQCCLNVDISNNPCSEVTKLYEFKEHIKNDHLCREKTSFGKELRRDLIIDVGPHNFKRIEVIEILKDESNPRNSLFFLERIWYGNQNKILFISYHHVGFVKDAEKYQYCVRIKDDKNPTLATIHQNKCLQIGLTVDNIKNSGRCLIMGLNSFMNINERRKILSLSVVIDYTEQEKKQNIKREQYSLKANKKKLKSSLEEKNEEEKVADTREQTNSDLNNSHKINEATEEKEKLPLKIEELSETKEEVIEHKETPVKKEHKMDNNEITFSEIVQKWFSILLSFFAFILQIIIYVYFLK